MRIFTNKLLVLLAANTLKTGTFTANELVDDTMSAFPKYFTKPDDWTKTLRSTVSHMVKIGYIIAIGETKELREVGQRGPSRRTFYCFTDIGRKARLEASTKIDEVVDMIEKISREDLADATKAKKPRIRRVA